MPKYYVYNNANRRIKADGYSFVFDVVEQFGGSWRGVLTLSDEGQIAALNKFASNLGITEITKDEFDEYLKKKVPSAEPSTSSLVPNPDHRIHPGVAAAVINQNIAPPIPKKGNGKIEVATIEVDDAVILGEAPFLDPLEDKSSKKKRVKNED